LCHNIDAEITLWSFYLWLRREVGGHGLESHMEKLGYEGDWRRGGEDVPSVGRNRILLRYFWSVQRCGSGALRTEGFGLQLSNPPQHKLKTTDFVDMLTSRFYMIFAST